MSVKSFLLFSLLLIGLTSCLGIDSDCEAFDIKRLPNSHNHLRKSFKYLYNNKDTLVLENTSWNLMEAKKGPLLAPCEPRFDTRFEDSSKTMSISYSWSYYPDETKDSVELNVSINSEHWKISLHTNKFHEDSIIFLNNKGRKPHGPDDYDYVFQATLVDFVVAEIYMASGEMWELVDELNK